MKESAPDRALTWIVLGNLFALATVYFTDGGLLLLLWPYWAQSVVIGWYAQRRMRALTKFSTDGFKRNDRQIEATPANAKSTANFFIVHYGGFHFGYLVFLLAFTFGTNAGGMVPIEVNGRDTEFFVGRLDGLDALFMVAVALSLVQGQRITFQEQVEADLTANRNLGGLMAFPYLRIIPMHLTIILGAMMSSGAGLVLFGGLKTLADVGMHAVERHWLKAR